MQEDIRCGISKAVTGSADNTMTGRAFSRLLHELKLYRLFDRMMLDILSRIENHELDGQHLGALMAMEDDALAETLIEGGEEIEKAAFRNLTGLPALEFLERIAENG